MTTATAPPAGTRQAGADFNATYIWMISAVAAMGGLLFGFLLFRAKLPETKGKTLEQIEQELVG